VGSSRENEEVDKDLVEIDRLDAVANLPKYQEETRKWRNKKVSLEYSGQRFLIEEEKEH
jgi:hypothetical protein